MMQIDSSHRLHYRLFKIDDKVLGPQDIEEIFAIDQDPLVMQYITGGKVTTRDSLQTTFLPRIRSYTDYENGFGMWRVALKDSDKCIGELIVRPMHFFSESPDYDDIELGWRFIRDAWGKGYATEAAKHLMTSMHLQQGIKQFTAIADTKNTASIGIMKKLGMQFVKHYIHEDPLGKSEVDLYSVTL